MEEEILSYQEKSAVLEPDAKTRAQLMKGVLSYSERFLGKINTLPAFHNPTNPTRSISHINDVQDIDEIIQELEQFVDKYGINPASPGHLGYIAGGGIYTASLGDYLADITNRFAGLAFASPGAVQIENEILNWCKRIVKYPKNALGNLTSGGSVANLIAIITARDYKKIEGERIQRSVVYLTQQTHHCIHKALRIAGLHRLIIKEIALDDNYQMSTHALEFEIEIDIKEGRIPFLIIGSCGSTDTGAVDPLLTLGKISKKYNTWYHIDAAYGGYFILCPQFESLLKGINSADSIVMDPHKTLFLPYGSGIVLVKNGTQLYESFHYTANYLQDVMRDPDNISPADLSPELTKHSRGLRMWIPLKLHGVEAFAHSLYEKHLLSRYFYQKVIEMGFEVGPIPVLSVCIYRYIPHDGDANIFNASLVEMIQEDGRIFISSTTIEGIFWIRIAVVCFRTHLKTIDLYLAILGKKLEELINRS